MKNNRLLWIFVLLFAVLMSIPWLVPHTGALVLVGFIPLLLAEDIASQLRIKHFWWYHYAAFVLWNAATTFWVCNATIGGGIFAILANALQMSVIFSLFRLSRKRLGGALPYIFLAVMWIAWERWYLQSAEISWPWLVLGNAFAGSTRLVQWYEFTGQLGGSLWVWAVNLTVYGLLVALADGRQRRWTPFASVCAAVGATLVIAGPVLLSHALYNHYEEKSEGTVDVVIGQPNFDPYEKFQSMTQAQQDSVLLGMFGDAVPEGNSRHLMFLAPETFTSSVVLSPEGPVSPSLDSYRTFLADYPGSSMLVGASSYEFINTRSKPSPLARQYGQGWILGHNSALMLEAEGSPEVFHKSKLVVGVEKTPYPKLFVPLDDWLCKVFHISSLMGRDCGQAELSCLSFGDVPLGCAVCYESVYGEYCTDYVRKGARAMTVITNDAWWGDTPGYRQHFNYSRLRAIELRRDLARCGNTGISAFIDQRGDIVERGPWWEPAVLTGEINLSSARTFFVRYGDITGRVCTLCFLLLLGLLIVSLFVRRR